MIVRNDGSFETNSLFPNTDWYGEGDYVIDETKGENKELIQKIKEHAPYMDLVVENGELVDVIRSERPVPEMLPPQPPTIQEQILAENQYQTALLEMQMLGGGTE